MDAAGEPHAGAGPGEEERREQELLAALDREARTAESWRLLRTAVPMAAAGLGVAGLYGSIAAGSDVPLFWLGVPLGLAGTACLALGYRARLSEVVSTAPRTTRGHGLLLLGGLLVAAAALVPPYAYA